MLLWEAHHCINVLFHTIECLDRVQDMLASTETEEFWSTNEHVLGTTNRAQGNGRWRDIISLNKVDTRKKEDREEESCARR